MMEMHFPDCYKNGQMKEKTIGHIKLPNGKVTIKTCYRNGCVSYAMQDFSFEFKTRNNILRTYLIVGSCETECDGVKTYQWRLNDKLALSMDKYFKDVIEDFFGAENIN